MSKQDLNIFVEDLASSKPAPGGGSASALYAVVASSLASMVCALTEGKAKYSQFEDEVKTLHNKILELKAQFENLIQADIDAFLAMSATYKLPHNTDEEKAQRHEAIQKALIPCTQAPLDIIKCCAQGIDLCDQLIGKTNEMAISDIGCAVEGFKAAMKSAWLNVVINIKAREDNTEDLAKQTSEFCEKYSKIADVVYKKVERPL